MESILAKLAKGNINILKVGSDSQYGAIIYYEYQYRRPTDRKTIWRRGVLPVHKMETLEEALQRVYDAVQNIRAIVEV